MHNQQAALSSAQWAHDNATPPEDDRFSQTAEFEFYRAEQLAELIETGKCDCVDADDFEDALVDALCDRSLHDLLKNPIAASAFMNTVAEQVLGKDWEAKADNLAEEMRADDEY